MIKEAVYQSNLKGLTEKSTLHEAVSRLKGNHETFAILLLDYQDLQGANAEIGSEAVNHHLDEITKSLNATLKGLIKSTASYVAQLYSGRYLIALESWVVDAHDLFKVLKENIEKKISANIGFHAVYGDVHPNESDDDASNRIEFALFLAKEAADKKLTLIQSEQHISRRDIKRGLTKERFTFLYQPILTNNGDVLAMEALVRWNQGTKVIPPNKFLPAVCRYQLMQSDFGWYVIKKNIQTLVNWIESGIDSAAISVNISPLQLMHEGFADRVHHEMRKHMLGPSHLLIEITEENEYTEESRRQLKKLSQYGYRILLDDFGTGFNNLCELNSFPIDIIKIDRALIHAAVNNQKQAGVLYSAVQACRFVTKSIVFEGIENAAHEELVIKHKAQFRQGYKYARPMTMKQAFDYYVNTRPVRRDPVTIFEEPNREREA